MNNWKKYKLSEVCQKITDGSHFSPKEDLTGSFLIASVKDMNDFGFTRSSCKKISENDYENLIKNDCVPNKNDILFSKDGTIGLIYFVKEKMDIALLSSIAIVRPNPELINPKFLFFFIKNPITQNYIKNFLKSGSALPRVVLKDLSTLPITFPTKQEQTRIANFLSQLDDRIELNRQINNNLEELADTYFKRLFFVNKINSGGLGELITEKTESVKNENLEQVQILSAVKTGDLINSEEYFTKQVFSQNISKYKKVTLWDFAYNPARINIGSIGMLNRDILGGVSPVYTVFRAKKGYEHFMNLLIKQNFTKKQIENLCFGGVRQVLRFSDLASIQIPIPTETEIKEFNTFYLPLLAKIESNKKQNETLANYRDSILPKLMSGEIEI